MSELSPKQKLILRVFCFVFMVVGVAISFSEIRNLRLAFASTDWPSVQGKIITSSVEKHTVRRGGERRIICHANILYQFEVEGVSYNGNRVTYGDYSPNPSRHAQNVSKCYPKGKTVSVHYMPGNPRESLLEPGPKRQNWIIPGTGCAFSGTGLLFFILSLLGVKKKQRLKGKELHEETRDLYSLIKPKVRQLK